jgi:serine/threonine protein kinase
MGPDHKLYAMKVASIEKYKILDFLKECIIQILLAEESRHEPNGPFVPELYELGYDSVKERAFLRSELMDGTLDKLLDKVLPSESDTVVPNMIRSISKIMQFFYTKLRFNHRDLKGDNIMYKTVQGTHQLKLIDFGFSCLHWKGLQINGSGYFSEWRDCFRRDRDLSQLLFYIVKFYKPVLSNALLDRINKILRTNVGRSRKCVLTKTCKKSMRWRNTYDFLDRSNVSVPAGNPDIVMEEMTRFLDKKPYLGNMPINSNKSSCLTVSNDKDKEVKNYLYYIYIYIIFFY